jgi:hypothetical protein
MTSIMEYLIKVHLPPGKVEAMKIRNQALHYEVHEGSLYRRSYLGPLFRCVTPEEANYLIREIHMGICGLHAGP